MKLLYNYRQQKFCCLTVLLACLSMSTATAAVAEYKKPKTTSAPDARTTTSSATRGKCLNYGDNNLNLTAIAPYSHIGQTTSSHPTFAWFIADSEFPLEFHLEEYTADSQFKTVYTQKLSSKPGIMSLSLPQNVPGLTAGTKYRWKVVMRCTRYKAVVTMAEIEVVAPTPKFKTAFSKTSGTSRLVDLYGANGLWYDALETTLNAADFHQIELQNQLIQELAAVESETNSSSVQQQGKKLRQISARLGTLKVSKNWFN